MPVDQKDSNDTKIRGANSLIVKVVGAKYLIVRGVRGAILYYRAPSIA